MSEIPLRFGPMASTGAMVARSGVTWLKEDGQFCQAYQPIASCHIGFDSPPTEKARGGLAHERRELFAVLAPRVGGVLRRKQTISPGGRLNHLRGAYQWDPDEVFAHISTAGPIRPDTSAPVEEPELLMLAAQRISELGESLGLLTGWYRRVRAWWGEASQGPFQTLVGLGICEDTTLLRGEDGIFGDLFAAVRGPCQVVIPQDEPLVLCAPVLLDQIGRTSEDCVRIAEDIARTFFWSDRPPLAGDWHFIAALMSSLQSTALTATHPLLTRGGLVQSGLPDAVLLSMSTEAHYLLRHKRLGYAVLCYSFRLAEAPYVNGWLKQNFDVERRSVEDIGRDYRTLIKAMPNPAAKVLIKNAISVTAREDVVDYRGLDTPLERATAMMRAKTLNLMLDDVARDTGAKIVDVDALTAEFGAHAHAPDGIHHSRRFLGAIQEEMLRLLGEAGLSSFAQRPTAPAKKPLARVS